MPSVLTPGAIDFTSIVRPGDTVIWSQGPSEPSSLTQALVAQRQRIGRFRAFLGSSYSQTFDPCQADYIEFLGIGAVGHTRRLLDAGALKVIPCHLSQLAQMMREGTLKIDVVLLQVARDRGGAYSYGSVCSYMPEAMRNARVVVAEVNEEAPWTYCCEPIDPARIDYVVNASHPLFDVPSRAATAEDVMIAKNVAPLIEDGATLQIGIGTLPDAILSELGGHRELGIHSGVIGDGVIKLINDGIVTNARKSLDRGVSVAGSLFGTKLLTKFADGNNAIRVDPISYTHDVKVLAGLESFTTINSAIEVDLFGQVNSEVANGKYVGTIGGQIDFVRGAQVSHRGKSILALPARLATDGPSRIVAALSGGFVTTARSDADIVVTQFGVAELKGQTVDERARRLIAVAHPDDREALSGAWWKAARRGAARGENPRADRDMQTEPKAT